MWSPPPHTQRGALSCLFLRCPRQPQIEKMWLCSAGGDHNCGCSAGGGRGKRTEAKAANCALSVMAGLASCCLAAAAVAVAVAPVAAGQSRTSLTQQPQPTKFIFIREHTRAVGGGDQGGRPPRNPHALPPPGTPVSPIYRGKKTHLTPAGALAGPGTGPPSDGGGRPSCTRNTPLLGRVSGDSTGINPPPWRSQQTSNTSTTYPLMIH
jgi:hypothetical protein